MTNDNDDASQSPSPDLSAQASSPSDIVGSKLYDPKNIDAQLENLLAQVNQKKSAIDVEEGKKVGTMEKYDPAIQYNIDELGRLSKERQAVPPAQLEDPRLVRRPEFSDVNRRFIIASSILMVAAIAGGAAVGNGSVGAMKSLSAAINGLAAGKREAYNSAIEEYNNQIDLMLKHNKGEVDKRNAIIADNSLSQQEKLDQIKWLNYAEGHKLKESDTTIARAQARISKLEAMSARLEMAKMQQANKKGILTYSDLNKEQQAGIDSLVHSIKSGDASPSQAMAQLKAWGQNAQIALTTRYKEMTGEAFPQLSLEISAKVREAQEKAIATPTAGMKHMMQTAPSVLDFVSKVRQDIKDAKGDGLGPLDSRWREFKAGKVGEGDKTFTALRTNVMLLTTALMNMHVGQRGGSDMMRHFHGIIDSGIQSPENMLSALDEIESYAKRKSAGEGIPGRTVPMEEKKGLTFNPKTGRFEE